MSAIEHRSDAYFTSDLIVALEHSRLVMAVLRGTGVKDKDCKESPKLGLARISIPDCRGVASSLERAKMPSLQETPIPPNQLTGIDDVISRLRGHFAEKYACWTPTIGKNRLVGRVIGGGKVSHGDRVSLAGMVSDEGKVSHGGDPAPAHASLNGAGWPNRKQTPGRGVRVGVLDTALATNDWVAGGWAGPSSVVLPGNGTRHAVDGHATFVVGLILSQAPGAVVEMRKVLDRNGQADSWDVANAIVDLGAAGLDVLNLSLSCFTEDDKPPLVLAAAIERLDPRIVVVAAAGNHGDRDGGHSTDAERRPAWPAALDHVVAVGAVHENGEPAAMTPPDVPWIDVHALGVDVVSTFLNGKVVTPQKDGSLKKEEFQGLASWSGTSFAAALVSGGIAARTKPGRVSARDAWEKLRPAGGDSAEGGKRTLLQLRPKWS